MNAKKIVICLIIFTQFSLFSLDFTFTPRKGHNALLFNNNIYIIGGISGYFKNKSAINLNEVWVSANGADTWTLISRNFLKPNRIHYDSIVFKNKFWIIGGYDETNFRYFNDIWSSEDGIKWEKTVYNAPFKPRANPALLVFKNKLWIIGGQGKDDKPLNDIWNSEDGLTWNPVTDNLHFSIEYQAQTVVFNDKIFLFSYGNGVFSSSNGTDWEEVTRENTIAKKYFYTVEVLNDSLYLICGENFSPSSSQTVLLNEVWRSKDGKNWEVIAPYPATNITEGKIYGTFAINPVRKEQSSLIYNNRLFLFGGLTGNNLVFLSDIWFSVDGEKWVRLR